MKLFIRIENNATEDYSMEELEKYLNKLEKIQRTIAETLAKKYKLELVGGGADSIIVSTEGPEEF